MKSVKRREILLAAPALALQAQNEPPPAAEVEQARQGMKANHNALYKVSLPMAAEPAFTFKA
jgi:hypothetical protein